MSHFKTAWIYYSSIKSFPVLSYFPFPIVIPGILFAFRLLLCTKSTFSGNYFLIRSPNHLHPKSEYQSAQTPQFYLLNQDLLCICVTSALQPTSDAWRLRDQILFICCHLNCSLDSKTEQELVWDSGAAVRKTMLLWVFYCHSFLLVSSQPRCPQSWQCLNVCVVFLPVPWVMES